VWGDAAEFIGTRQFTRFAPAMPRESAAGLLSGWQRAVRAALFWARDTGEPTSGKKRKKKRVTRALRKGASSRKGKAERAVTRKSRRKSR